MQRRVLAPVVVLAALAAAPSAWAQSVAVPSPPIVGDGSTPARLQVLTPPGARIKVLPSRGEAGTVEAVAVGYVFTFVPPVVGERTTIPVTVRVRGGGVSQDLQIPVEVVPSWVGGFSITADPSSISAGQSATLKVRPSSSGPLTGTRSLRIEVSEGTIGALVPAGDGSWAARYTAPSRVDGPRRPLVIVADAAAPTTFVDAEVLPVTHTRNITLDAPADTMAVLRVGSREYGPNKVSPAGKVAFDVELHPDVRQGTLTASSGSGEPVVKTVELPMDVPASLAFAPMPDKAGGGTTITVPMACRLPDGKVCSPRDATFEPSGGSVGGVTVRGELLIVPWTLPDTGTATLTAKIGETSASARIVTVPSPVSLTLSANPPSIPDATTPVEITARAKDPGGKGVTGRIPGFTARNGTLLRRPADNRDGTYTGTWRLERGAPWIEAVAWTRLTPTGLAAQRLVAWPVVDATTADGATTLSLFVVAEDAVGMPVANVPLELLVPQGDAALPPSARTDANGVALIDLKVGVEPGLVDIRVKGAGLETATRLWQTAPGTAAPTLTTTGSTPDVEAVNRWKDRLAAIYVGQAAAPVVTVAPATPPPLPGTTAAPVVAAPVATAPVAGTPVAGGGMAAPGKSKAPKTPKTGGNSGYARARLGASLTNTPLWYSSKLSGEQSADFAPEASFSLSPVLGQTGLQADAEVWAGPDRRLGIDLRGRASVYRLDLGASKVANAPWEAELAVRYRAWDNGTWSAYAGGGFMRTSGMVLQYNSSRTSADIVNFDVYGLQAGGGLRMEDGNTLFEVDLQSVWSPGPAVLRAEARTELAVAEPLLLTLALGGDQRFLTYKPDADTDTKVRVTQTGLDIRVGITIPFF